MNTLAVALLFALAAAAQAGYFGAAPAYVAAPYAHYAPAPVFAAPFVHKVAAPVVAAPAVVAAPVVAKVPTAVSYSYFHQSHHVPVVAKLAAPVYFKAPLVHAYHG
ncbi:cuticle protein 16.5-like [Ornithodoros turicata]|uniref:Putative secreted protein n=1 Tax=Ornithodoros turicata TaxID=34597 RepID=A0A2R5LAI2_9ACAR